MAEVTVPERQSVLGKWFGALMTGAQGMQGFNSFKSMFRKGDGTTGGGTTTSGGGGGGGTAAVGASAYGGKALVGGSSSSTAPATTPATSSGAQAAGGESVGSYAAPAAALGTTAYDEYHYQNKSGEYKNKGQDSNRYAIGQGTGFFSAQKGLLGGGSPSLGKNMPSMPSMRGLSLTEQQSPNQMDAMERRYNSQQTAMQDISNAKDALKSAGLPKEEQRRIAMKLDQAQQNIGGKRNGRSIYTPKA